VFSLVVAGCVEPYKPSISIQSINVLVIDGFANASDSTIQVILSRAVPTLSSDSSYAEKDAQVSIESDNGSLFPLSEGEPGFYFGKAFSSLFHKYKLNVITQDQKKYSSDFIDILEAPPIDSVYWRPSPTGVALYVDSHNDGGGTGFYRWTYDETWKFRTPYYVYKEWKDGQLLSPPPANNICWKSASSTEILVYSTAALKQDKVSNFQVNFLPKGIQKLSTKYSINIHQRSINANNYNYWLQLQTKSQSGGSLFDVLPTQVVGNVHSDTDPSETVLGYFSGSTVTSKRIFIDTLELPIYLQSFPAYYNCPPDSVPFEKVSSVPDGTLFYNTYILGFIVAGYLTTRPNCMDCRLSGGTVTPPSFWK
jgi:hypothetical protein